MTGDVTGDVTGNVTASSGTTTLNNLTVNGTADFTSTKLTNVTDPVNAQDAATKNYVDTEVANLVDSAPGTLNTLNELADALGDDPNFSTTITNSIATKLPLAGGTMTGDISLGANKATSTATPATADTLTRKGYVDTQRDTRLALSGGTMTGTLVMGANNVTTTADPTTANDLARKGYVDSILGSATAASTSASNAATSATNAATSATNAAASATSAAASYDSFDDRYLGSKSSSGGEPTVDNDGDALLSGAIYWDNTNGRLRIYDGANWQNAAVDTNTVVAKAGDTMTGDLAFGDNVTAKFGASNDLNVYHDGSDSYIKDTGTGSMLIGGDSDVALMNSACDEYKAKFISNGAAELYYDNAKKFETTSTGVTVTGTATTTGLTTTNFTLGGTAVSASAAEINHLSGVTSNVQTQINNLSGGVSAGFAIAMAIAL